MDVLLRLERWYASQCDGDWEHQYGVHVETLDNPGWRVKIDVSGTPLEGQPFAEIAEGVGAETVPDSPRWLRCWVENGQWHAATDELQLARALGLFLDWAAKHAEPNPCT